MGTLSRLALFFNFISTSSKHSTAILNYKWAQTGIYDIYDKGIAGVLISLLATASAAYYNSGDRPTATTLAGVAILQGLGVRNGLYSHLV